MNQLITFSKFSGLKPNKTKCETAGFCCSELGSSGTLWHEIR